MERRALRDVDGLGDFLDRRAVKGAIDDVHHVALDEEVHRVTAVLLANERARCAIHRPVRDDLIVRHGNDERMLQVCALQLRREVQVLSAQVFEVPGQDLNLGEQSRGSRAVLIVPRDASRVRYAVETTEAPRRSLSTWYSRLRVMG